MPQATRIDRARGSLLGMAIGDALGAPLEGLSAQQVRAHYGQVTDYVDGVRAWRKKSFRWRLEGLYTDDTQQALVLAECLRLHGRIDVAWVAATYLEMARPRGAYLGAHRSAGKTFRTVISDLEGGAAPDRTGCPSAGIGAAMRIAPVGLFHAERPAEMLDAVLEASLLTHRDVRSLAGAVAVAAAVRRFLEGAERTPSLLFHLAHEVAEAERRMAERLGDRIAGVDAYGGAMSRAVARVESLLEQPRDRAYQAIMDQARRLGAEPDCRRPTMGFPPACIPTCLYLLFTTDSLEEALVEVVNLGGDADTAGAILGALAGAHYGQAEIPERWLRGLRNAQGVALRAEALVPEGRVDAAQIPDLIATERELTRLEARARDEWMGQLIAGDDMSTTSFP
jgi:ADP-ribosylglycohydrolase